MTTKTQIGDQTAKGGIIGLLFYAATKWNVDPALIVILTPIVTGVLAVISTKIGDPVIASFFDPKKNVEKD